QREESQARQGQMKHAEALNGQDTPQTKLAERIADLAFEIVKTQDAGRADIFQRVFPGAPWLSNAFNHGAPGTASPGRNNSEPAAPA
ncbi:MAG: hypothetical protein AB7J32_20915, partial [Pseudonocardia sp.]